MSSRTELFVSHASEDPAVSRRRGIIVLAVCMALQMTGFVMVSPLFARRFTEFGAPVQSLATSAMAYALAATVSAPFMGALADRVGRRRLVLVSLAAYAFAFIGFRLAPSALVLILSRGLAGAFTAGLIPAATGMVADLAPADRRAQWLGILSGASSVGWVIGPIVGGALYDRWGYELALSVAILTAAGTFVLALLMLPETHAHPGVLAGLRFNDPTPRPSTIRTQLSAFRRTLPLQLSVFAGLLLVTFVTMFAWAFMEPRFMYFAYDDLGWSSSMLGASISTYGTAVMLGEFGLSRLSDRIGRKPVIVLGLALFTTQFIGLAFFRDFLWIAAAFAVAGLGNALFDPALTASILDIAPAEHRARVLGLKSTVGSIGSILGPALVVLFAPIMPARVIFLAAAAIVVVTVGVLLTVRLRGRELEYVQERAPKQLERSTST